jgi:hypothetical protein
MKSFEFLFFFHHLGILSLELSHILNSQNFLGKTTTRGQALVLALFALMFANIF